MRKSLQAAGTQASDVCAFFQLEKKKRPAGRNEIGEIQKKNVSVRLFRLLW